MTSVLQHVRALGAAATAEQLWQELLRVGMAVTGAEQAAFFAGAPSASDGWQPTVVLGGALENSGADGWLVAGAARHGQVQQYRGAAGAALACPVRQRETLLGVLYLAWRQLPGDLAAVTQDAEALSLVAALAHAGLELHAAGGSPSALDGAEDSQERLVRDVQMISSFAHELRNALFASTSLVDRLLGAARAEGIPGFKDGMERTLAALRDLVGKHAPPAAQEELARLVGDAQVDLGALDEELADTRASMSRGLHTVQQLLEYNRLGRVKRSGGTARLASVVERVIKDIAPSLQKSNVSARQLCQPSIELPIAEDHLYSIISNLVINARDALQVVGERARVITIEGRTEGGDARIRVVDNADGIPESARARLFEPFFTTKGAQGTGLGLAITRRLVHLYEGRIDVESEVGAGTTFEVQLPLTLPASVSSSK